MTIASGAPVAIGVYCYAVLLVIVAALGFSFVIYPLFDDYRMYRRDLEQWVVTGWTLIF